MIFDLSLPIVNGVTDPEPVADPDLDTPALLRVARLAGDVDNNKANALLLGLEGVAAETVTVSLYAIDDATLPADGVPIATTKYYLIAAAVVVTAHVLSQVIAAVPLRGFIYVRMTADSIAADRQLKLSLVNR
jgi:hypothetical protein